MADTYTWHPRIVVKKPQWPLAQDLLEDELLSSWLIRNAFAHGCSPLTLTGHLWPSWRCWTVDLDRGMTERQAQRLSTAAGITLPDLSSCTLMPIAQAISPGLTCQTATWPWILVIGARNRRHAGGLQCCPLCLEQGVPYYRQSWRLAWHTCCETHLARLIDCCQNCGAPLQPHRLECDAIDCSKCYRCGRRLWASLEELRFEAAALAFQIDGDNCLKGGGLCDGTFYEPQQWFYHARFIWGLLRAAAAHGSKAFTRFHEVFRIGKLDPPASGLPIEMLPVADRIPFLGAVWKILAAGQPQIHEAILECSMVRSCVPLPAGESPASLRMALDDLPAIRAYKKPHGSTKRKPTSASMVRRMWARLKRKVLRDA